MNHLKSFLTGVLIVFFILSAPAVALTPEEQNTIDVFQNTADSVVFITNVQLASGYSFNDLEIPRGNGSGFVWDTQGHIVTNYHVVQGGDVFYVALRGQSKNKALVVGVEPRKDLAVLKLDEKTLKIPLKPVRLGDSTKLQVGQKVIAIGNPYGLDHTMTTGVISALGREMKGVGNVTIREVIQTDASINPGNSGGPLIDSSGALIGMNTAIYSESGSSSGIGFAVPVSFIKKLVPQLIKHGKVIQPGLGIAIVADQVARQVSDVRGAIVYSVEPGSAADKAGIKGLARDRFGRIIVSDIIIGINDTKVDSYDALYNTLDRFNVGDEVKVKIQRNDRPITVTVKLQAL